MISTLEEWCNTCDGMLSCLEDTATRANSTKAANLDHKRNIEQKVIWHILHLYAKMLIYYFQ